MRRLLMGVFVAAVAGAPGAQVRVVNKKLSGPMVAGVVGDVGQHALSPSGDRVLYLVHHDADVEGSGEPAHLEVAPADGSGTPLALSSVEDIRWMRWASGGDRVAFVVQVAVSFDRELRSVLADGSAAPVTLSPGMDLASPDGSAELTADGSRIVFLTQGRELYSVLADGSAAPVRLDDAGGSDGDVRSFVVSGSTVVYRAGWPELHSVPVDGSAPRVTLTDLFPAEGVLADFAVDASTGRAVYLARESSVRRLFSVPVDGSAAPVPLSPAPTPSREVTSFAVSDGRVVYRADQNADQRFELFLAPVDGSAAAVLLAPVPPGDSVNEGFAWSPDGDRVVYGQNTGSVPANLFSVRASDGVIAALYPASLPFLIAPDSSRVVLLGSSDRQLYSVPIDGSSAALQINPEFPVGGEVIASASDEGFAITPDSLRVVYRAHGDALGIEELYWVPIEPAGTPVATKLNPELAPGGSVREFLIAPDSSWVTFRAEVQSSEITELFRSPGAIAVNGALPLGAVGDVDGFVVRNGRAVYLADEQADGVVELFGVPTNGNSPAVVISGSLVAGGDVHEVALSPDGATAVYLAEALADNRIELFSVPSDGSAPPVLLNTALVGDVGAFHIAPDGTRVVYQANQTSAPGMRMHSVPIHGGATTPLADVFGVVEFSPDSSHVVFHYATDLYAVPIDGSTAPVLLAAGGMVDFEPLPGGSRVAYTRSSGGVVRLFSCSVLGGPSIDLSGTLVSGGNVQEFAPSVDGERVVYIADAAMDQRFLLLSVPSDGSSPAVVLNGPMVGGADVERFLVSPDGANVLYSADEEVNEVVTMHRVAVDGSSPAVLLSEEGAGTGSFELSSDGEHVVMTNPLRSLAVAGGAWVVLASGQRPFAITSNGRRVVYSEAGRLKVTPITGGPALFLSPPTNEELSFALDGPRVVHRADLVADVVELHVSWLEGLTGAAPPDATRSVVR